MAKQAKKAKQVGPAKQANDPGELSLQIEAWRKLKDQLMGEARDRFPFKDVKGADVTKKKIEKYMEILDRLMIAYDEEEKLWEKLGQ